MNYPKFLNQMPEEWRTMPKPQSRCDPLVDVLDRIEDYLEASEDVRDGPDGEQRPNQAMQLRTDLIYARVEWARTSLPSEIRTLKTTGEIIERIGELDLERAKLLHMLPTMLRHSIHE